MCALLWVHMDGAKACTCNHMVEQSAVRMVASNPAEEENAA